MENHYVCKSCGGQSEQAKACEDESCPMKGQPMEACSCQDGKHGMSDVSA